MVELELWGRSPIPLGDPAFTADGRLVVTHHPAFETDRRASVFTGPDALVPYPDAEWNAGGGTANAFDSPQGLRTDRRGVMWFADLGKRAKTTPRVVGWDTREERLHRVIPLPPPATHEHSEPQDLVIDERRGRLYIADEGAGDGGDGSRAGLIVVDLGTGEARRVLEGAACTKPEDVDVIVDGRVLQAFDKRTGVSRNVRVGVDGLILDDRAEHLYFGPLNGSRAYRVRCDALADPARARGLEAEVETYAARPNAGGFWMDAADNLYVVEIEARAIGVIPAADRTYRRLAEHPEMVWPDGLIGGPDGCVYVTASALPFSPAFNGGAMTAEPPYKVFRFKSPESFSA